MNLGSLPIQKVATPTIGVVKYGVMCRPVSSVDLLACLSSGTRVLVQLVLDGGVTFI